MDEASIPIYTIPVGSAAGASGMMFRLKNFEPEGWLSLWKGKHSNYPEVDTYLMPPCRTINNHYIRHNVRLIATRCPLCFGNDRFAVFTTPRIAVFGVQPSTTHLGRFASLDWNHSIALGPHSNATHSPIC